MAETIYKALAPEVSAARSFKSKVSMRLEGRSLILSFKAPGIPSLRAAVNSFCRWVGQLVKVLEVAEA